MTDGAASPDLSPKPALYPAAWSAPLAPTPKALLSVGIIMRTKDRPLLLHRALSSVLSQTHPAWRLYLVNDGGDRFELEEVLKHYEPVFAEKLKVIHHSESLGMERASNAALAFCTEDLIVVHDDDDSWHPEFLAEASSFLAKPENRHFIGVVTGCELVEERIEAGEVVEIRRMLWPHCRSIIDFRRMLIENQYPPICFVFRRAAVTQIGGFNSDMPVLGDWEYNLRLMLLGDIGSIDRPLARYHHRIKGTNSIYSNSVVDGVTLHELYNVRLRNGMLRAALAERPEMLGFLQPILHALGDIEKRLDRIEAITQKSFKSQMFLSNQTLFSVKKYLNRAYWNDRKRKLYRSVRKRINLAKWSR